MVLGLLFGIASTTCEAQVTLQSSGQIPSEIFSSTSNKYERKKQESLDSSFHEPRAIRLSRLKFYEQSYYLIDAIKNNAGIYVNDSYTKLLNDIADEILKNEPEIRKQVFLYAYRAPFVNAFSTDQGDIFFTTGLLAHVENEAQLAFVVGHEIVHFLKQHNTESFNERIKIARGEGRYAGMDVDNSIEEIHDFSKELEKEADLLSLDYYLKSTYAPNQVIESLNMLRTSHLGLEEREFDFELLLGKGVKLSEELLPEEVPEMSEDSMDDDKSTHPNVSKRIAYCQEVIDKSEAEGNMYFRNISMEDFKELRTLARYEQLEQLYNGHYYAKAIYNASIMYQDRESEIDRAWLRGYIDKCLDAVVHVQNSGLVSPEKRERDYTGELFKVHHVLYKSKKYEIATLRFLKEYHRYLEHPTEINQEVTKNAIHEMIKPMERDWRKYEDADFDTAEIRRTKMDHLLPQLREIFHSDTFKSDFNDISDYYDQVKKKGKVRDARASNPDLMRSIKDRGRLLVINPYYLRIDETVEGYVDHQRSYENEVSLIAAIKDAGEANGIEMDILDVRDIQQSEGDKFDDIAALNDYIGRFAAQDMDPNHVVLPASEERIDGIRNKYNSDYVMWVGVRSYKGTSFKNLSKLLINMLLPNYLPYSILSTFEKDHEVELFYAVFDLKEHRVVKLDSINVSYMKDNRNLLTVYINALLQDI